jgi:hypothetical protein
MTFQAMLQFWNTTGSPRMDKIELVMAIISGLCVIWTAIMAAIYAEIRGLSSKITEIMVSDARTEIKVINLELALKELPCKTSPKNSCEQGHAQC